MSIKLNTFKLFSILAILAMLFSNVQPPHVQAQSGDGLERHVNAESGRVSFITPFDDKPLSAARALGESIRPRDPAMALAVRYGPEFGLQNPERSLTAMDSNRSDDGRLTVRFQQNYENIPVMGGELIVNTNDNGDLYSISGEVSPRLSISTQPTINSEQARQTALGAMAKWYEKTPEDFISTVPELWIYDESLLQSSTRPVELTWRMEITSKDAGMPVRELVLVSAQRGNISQHFNQIDTAWPASQVSSSSQHAAGVMSSLEQTSNTVQSSTHGQTIESEELAGILYVASTGSDSNSCDVPASPCATIGSAINKAAAGNTILVAMGTYPAVSINKSIILSGGWDEAFTTQTGLSTVDANYTTRGIEIVNSPAVQISRFIVKRGKSYQGGGIFISNSTVELDRMVIFDNTAEYTSDGGGIMNAGSLTITRSLIYGNTASSGAGISSDLNDLIITNSAIFQNTATSQYGGGSAGGIGFRGSLYANGSNSKTLKIENTTISQNTAYTAGAISASGTVNINHTTIIENVSQKGANISGSSAMTIKNSILANNITVTPENLCNGSIMPTLDGYSIVYSTWFGCSFPTGQPREIDPQLGKFISTLGYAPLKTGSPAINAGNPATCLATDQRNITRTGGCDLGAYEFTDPGPAIGITLVAGDRQRAFPSTAFAEPLVALALDAQGSPVPGTSITFTAPASGASGTFTSTGTNTETVLTDGNGYATTSTFTANSENGTYTLTASSGALSPFSYSLENGGLWYVSPAGNDANACNTKESPCLTINAAVGKAVSMDAIFVAAGTYPYTGGAGNTPVVTINKDISLQGGWNDTFTSQNGISIIDGQASHPGILISWQKKATIDSFTVQNGLDASQGGGITVEGSLTLRNSTIHSNTGYGGNGAGGILVEGTLVTENVTIANNSNSNSYAAGGLNVIGGMATLRNTILANNTSSTNPDCKGTISFSDHSLIGKKTGGCTVTQRFYDIFDVNPKLGSLTAGTYPLLFGSPAIDAGNYSACLPRDQRDVTRPQGASCDMGAYEYVFEHSNTGILAATYNGNHLTSLPGTLICNQTNPTCSNGDAHAKAAHQYAIGTYNLYKSKHSRSSIDNNGFKINSTVHYSSGYANAFWNGYMMVYGDKYGYPLADDVVAHELTHGVTQYESNLFYYYQAGAINESFSDLWGEYYDQTNALGNDAVGVKWILGEDISGYPIPSGFSVPATRSMSNPPALQDPDKMSSTYYYEGEVDNGGVHTNSGVNNKAVYLMVQGGAFNGRTVTPLGWDKTAAIYYEVNTNLLTSGADYSDLYYALQTACASLLGQKGLVASDCMEVKDAIDAVEMNAQPATNFNAEAAPCPTYGTYPKISLSDDLENGTGNWAFDNGTYPRWQYDSPYGLFAQSGQHSLYADDYPQNDDMPTDARATLVSFTVPANGYLWFAHAYDFEYDSVGYYDGGVLEYSKDNGITWTDAAPLIQSNGYRGKVSYDYGNPLANRSAFVGSSHGYISTRLNLASLAGQTVSFRWRMGLDGSFASWGWWVDNLQVYTCQATTFADVPFSHPYYQDIEILYANNLTGGCQLSPLKYCPDQILNRAQAAAFMLRGNFGPSYIPPTPTHIFKDDWSKGPWAEGWAEGMRNEGISAGCLANPLKYCPWDQIPREQAMIFALKLRYGKLYTPPPATGTVFADMTNPSYYATAWAEQAYKDGIIKDCGIDNATGKPKFCPKVLVSRGLAAYIIVRAKNLTMP